MPGHITNAKQGDAFNERAPNVEKSAKLHGDTGSLDARHGKKVKKKNIKVRSKKKGSDSM